MDSQKSYLIFVILSLGFLVRFFLSHTTDRSQSKFKISEADLPPKMSGSPKAKGESSGGDSRKPNGPMLLEGFRFDGAPHEILGVSPQASEIEIQKAYKELIKRFHPDKVGRPGSQAWLDAQPIAESLNRARTELLARRSQTKKGS
jgi:hypothetical protein